MGLIARQVVAVAGHFTIDSRPLRIFPRAGVRRPAGDPAAGHRVGERIYVLTPFTLLALPPNLTAVSTSFSDMAIIDRKFQSPEPDIW
jgi:hypothetical protein